jgi:hypothetical protein
MASWIMCLLDNVPDISDLLMKRIYDVEKVNLTLFFLYMRMKNNSMI